MAKKKNPGLLNVFMNGKRVGRLEKNSPANTLFQYDKEWLAWDFAISISMSLPLRENAYSGDNVQRFFENLLPDSEPIRRQIAARVGAAGFDFYSLLEKIGRDCVGALQIVPEEDVVSTNGQIEGTLISDEQVETIIKSLTFAPLGNSQDNGFRISLAGAQEKTALTRISDRWYLPAGTTPTTHILKPQIGKWTTADGVIDMSQSVENEYYCMKLVAAFGLTVATADIQDFGDQRVLVVERFDRQIVSDGRLIRLPQEDLCQALGFSPNQKYQSMGGPSAVDILKFLGASDVPDHDQRTFFKSQILFWLIGATDGHAKNFSLALTSGGGFRLAPLYDILTVQHGVDANQIRHKDFQLAMSVGKSKYYRLDAVSGRHFRETGMAAGLSTVLVQEIFDDVIANFDSAFTTIYTRLPANFPESLHLSVKTAAIKRLKSLMT